MATGAQAQATLEKIKAAGLVTCGANTGLPASASPIPPATGPASMVDYCRALAAAIFDDPTKVKFVPLAAKDRFPVLQSGEIDVLFRNTTWTMSRDTTNKGNFAAVNYYDGQGFLVKKALNLKSALDLNGANHLRPAGHDDRTQPCRLFPRQQDRVQAVVFAGSDETIKAYGEGRCDAFTTDASGLYAERLKLAQSG